MSAAPRLRLPSAIAVVLIVFSCLLASASAGGSSAGDAYAQLVMGDNPVAYWRMNETSGTTAADATNNHLDATWRDPDHLGRVPTLGVSGIPALAPDTAVQFSSTEDNAEPFGVVGYDTRLNPTNPGSFSVEAWVKPMDHLPTSAGDLDSEAILCSRSINAKIGYMLYLSAYSGHPQFAFNAGDNNAPPAEKNWIIDTESPALQLDQWYHVVATLDATTSPVTMHLYVNGQDVGTVQHAEDFFPNTSGTATTISMGDRLGVMEYGYFGALDEVAFYGHELGPADVLAHYQAGTGTTPQPKPTLSLSNSTDPSAFDGGRTSFRVSVGGVSDATGTELTAKVTGANPKTITATVEGTLATFSYKGTNPGKDTVQVSGMIDGHAVSSNSVNVYWLAGSGALARSFSPPGSSMYAKSATQVWADPVNSSTGNFYQSVTDVSLPGAGVPFSLDRTYNSRDETVGVIGKGWSASLFPSLSSDEVGNATLKAGDGQEIGFVLQQDGSYVADKDVTASLEKTSSGYDLNLQDQETQHFDSDGHLASWLDPNGQGLHFAYDGQGRLSSVTDAGGREVDFAYDGQGRLTQVTLPDSTTLAYGYDGDLLTSFTNQAGVVTTYAYNGNGYLKSVTDPDGKLVFENTYDDQGRVLTQKDALGAESTFDWSSGPGVATDARGEIWKDAYNDDGQLSKRIDPLGNEAHYVYDDANNLLSVTDPLGNTTTMTYDGRGNMLARTDALGNAESWTYDEDNNVTSHTDQLGHITRDTYDSNGNLLTETDPTGAVTTNEYDSAGRLVSTTDPLGRTTRSVYDGEGNLTATISPSGARTTMRYDSLGRQVAETDPLGNTTASEYDAAGRLIKTTDPLGHSTTSTYDDAGRLIAKTDANGNTTHYHYDDAGRQVAVINPDGSGTHSAYDAVDNLISTTDALGNVTRYEYDTAGRQTATISPTGERTTTTYDANGNAVVSTDALGHTSETTYDALGREVASIDPLGRTTKTVHNAAGNVVKKTDPLGNTTTSTYDAAGRVIKETDPLGRETTSTHDEAGQLVSETDANDHTTLHAYDLDGREISATSPSGAITTSTYDAAGNLISRSDANDHTSTYVYDAAGNKTSETNPLDESTTFAYDANGNQISETDPLGHTSETVYDSMNRGIESVDPLDRRTKTAYDLNGNVVAKTDPLGNATTSEYDAEGRLVSETDPLDHATTYTYDDAGQLVAKTDANAHTTHYSYDAAGEKVSVTAPGDAVTTYEYDAAGNVVKRTDANGHATTYSYDAAGNKISKTNPLGSIWTYSYDAGGNLLQTKTPSGGTIDQAYDAENRLTHKSYSDSTPTVSYSYDPAGNKVSMTDGSGTTRYSYDEADRRISALSASGAFLYSYDEDGNLLSRTYPNGLETAYGYNDVDQMVMATATGETTRYSYDANGSLASILHPNGILDERSHDAAGRITTITGTASHGKPFFSRSYTYDAVGNPTSLKATDAKEHSSFSSWWKKAWWKKDGALTKWRETYSYDAQDRLTKACMNASCSRYFKYSYDSVGNRTSLQTRKKTTLYSYDAADELVSRSKGHHKVTHYSYDLNGNETQEGSTRYTYNLENKLTQVVDKGKNVSYTYTGDGLMAARSTRSQTTSYSWDTSSGLDELALETDSRGAGRFVNKDARAYTYGAGPLGIVTQRESYTFHTDSLGSVIQLSDSRGKLVESYRYSPYGEDYGPGFSGEAQDEELNPIRFTGQYLDSESDLYNMRAREYELETGRFLEVDPLEADAGDPYLGVYVYADDQPTVKTDPSGERAMGGFGFFGADYQVNIVPTGAYSGYSYWSTLEPVIGWVGILPPFIRYQPYYNIASAYSGWASAYNVLNSSIKTHRITQRNALKRISVIKRALSAYGTKYVFGGGSSQGPTRGGGGEYPNYARNHVGFDCSGLMMYAYAGIRSLPHYSGNKGGWGDYTEGTATTYTKALPADLVFYHGWSDPQHVAMYLGGGKIVEAPQTWIKVPRYDNNGPNGWTTGTPEYVRISSVFEHGTPVGFRKLL